MTPQHLFLFLATTALLSSTTRSEDIRLNLAETPDRTGAYYIADKDNSDEVPAAPHGRVLCIDQRSFPMHVGDWAATDSLGYMVKYFLLFHSERTVLLADSSKWARTTLVSFAKWDEFDEFYTDKKPPEPFRRNKLKIIYP